MIYIFMLFLKIFAAVALLALVVFLALLFDGADRIFHARMQRRYGPPILQPVYDILKLLGKENIVPRRAARFFFVAAPVLALVTSLMVFLYMPAGPFPAVLGTEGDMVLVIYLLAMSGLFLAIGGFASGNPIASIGGQREITLMMSYEFPLAVVVSTLAWVAYRTGMPGAPFSLETFVATSVWSVVSKTGLFGLLCLFASLVMVVPGETGKGPMDIPEAKTEILDGIIIEYSGVNLAMLKVVFALRSFALSVFITSLFVPLSFEGMFGFGGFFVDMLDFVFFWVKVFVVQMLFVTLMRTAFGRFKIQQASRFYITRVAGLSVAGMILLSIDVLCR
ncbi:MAG: NADH-quinone oxidoreductase subunit H [Synergistaceae bacterium]|jgi:formate hydrogenlyase subunit 4|nr:NADH-quinone oxidoreductase subunit H [Synergistaceae bacterium]